MGTRGFICFVTDGREVTGYNHWDSYPEGLGVDVLRWLRGATDSVSALRERARRLRVVSEDATPSDADIAALVGYMNTTVGKHVHGAEGQRACGSSAPSWYQLLRETQGDPQAMLDAGVVVDASDFPLDSLFAEWGYVIDLDAERFEVYRGFQQVPHTQGRFAGRGDPEPNSSGGTYYPVALAGWWPLSALPSDDELCGLDVAA